MLSAIWNWISDWLTLIGAITVFALIAKKIAEDGEAKQRRQAIERAAYAEYLEAQREKLEKVSTEKEVDPQFLALLKYKSGNNTNGTSPKPSNDSRD